jgi:hypothetical protein
MAIALLALVSATAGANTITPAYVVGSFVPGVSITYTADVESGEIHSGDGGFTIYDVAGYTSATYVGPYSFAVSTSATGTPFGPPPNPLGSVDSGRTNVHFTFTGTSFESVGSTPLGTFTIFTTATSLGIEDWASQDHTLGPSTGSVNSATKSLHNSTLVGVVPDGGSTAMLLGSVLFAFGALRRKFNGR